MTLHLIPEPEEKASELLRDLTANDSDFHYSGLELGEREIPGGLEAAADAGGDGKSAWFVIYTPHTGASL
jgi:hypothetical protein